MLTQSTIAKGTILVVDDEAAIVGSLRRFFRRRGYQVLSACNGREALDIMSAPDCVVHVLLTDMRMPVMDGAELLREVSRRWPAVRRILLTGYADLATTQEAARQGWVEHSFSKPWEPDRLERCVEQLVSSPRAATTKHRDEPDRT